MPIKEFYNQADTASGNAVIMLMIPDNSATAGSFPRDTDRLAHYGH